MIPVDLGGVRVYRSRLLDSFPGIGHAFSTRLGGASEGPWASLNLSSSTGDSRERVLENRRRLCGAAGAPWPPAIPRQALGAEVASLAELDREADAVVADRGGTLTLSADCVLVLFYDPRRRAIANVHSSRHGARGAIAKKAVARMATEFGTDPRDLVAAVGPSIGPCCYEVREDVAELWRGEPFLLERGGRKILDLWAATRAHLEEAGVRSIDEARICTKCRPDEFYSYRRDGERTGRFGALLWLR